MYTGPGQTLKVSVSTCRRIRTEDHSTSGLLDSELDIRTMNTQSNTIIKKGMKERKNDQKSEGYIAFGLFVRSFVRSFDTLCVERGS